MGGDWEYNTQHVTSYVCPLLEYHAGDREGCQAFIWAGRPVGSLLLADELSALWEKIELEGEHTNS